MQFVWLNISTILNYITGYVVGQIGPRSMSLKRLAGMTMSTTK